MSVFSIAPTGKELDKGVFVVSCPRISKHLREFAKAGFREFFGVISTSDFTSSVFEAYFPNFGVSLCQLR